MFHMRRSQLVLPLFSLTLFAGALSATACVEAGLQSGVFACNTDSQCPPGGFFCDNYFNTYMYHSDVTARPVMHDYWGFCLSENEVIEKQSPPEERILVEICANNKDDDGDGDADCADLECQTSPTCRAIINSDCATDEDGAFPCSTRLGFPRIRNGANPTEQTCPEAVGFHGDGIEAQFDNLCLPRCRLYLPYKVKDMLDSSDSIFFGSDKYCNTVVAPRLITASRFEGGELRCEHVSMQVNGVSLPVQSDVCLPKPTAEELGRPDCTACNVATQDCLIVSYLDREMIAWDDFKDEVVPIPPHAPEAVQLRAVYCMEKMEK